MPRAKAFYEGVFGKQLKKGGDSGAAVSEMWAFPGKPNNAGATGALVKMENGPSGIGGVIIYFECEDCAFPASFIARQHRSVYRIRQRGSTGERRFLRTSRPSPMIPIRGGRVCSRSS
jgi:uncharacterized protein